MSPSALYYFGERSEVTQNTRRITKVTFTLSGVRRTIQSWFGSSGGGLPRRPELEKVQDAFLFRLQGAAFGFQELPEPQTWDFGPQTLGPRT